MEFLRRAVNPWGQEVFIGIAWDLMWAAAILGGLFVIGHAVYVWKFAPEGRDRTPERAVTDGSDLPDRIVRHSRSARAFHWLMSLTMLLLLITAFVPVIGIRFPWVTLHWAAGIGLLVTVVYHIVHAWGWQDMRAMWIGNDDIDAGRLNVRRFFKRSGPPAPKAGKYPVDHKLYHNTIAVVSVAAIVTGLLMMFRVDTPFWTRNPYILSDATWGIVYVVHGVSGVALIAMVMAHIYFAVRPEKWWITRSMIAGWIRRDEFLAHHDPNKWVIDRAPKPPSSKAGVGSGAGIPEGVTRDRARDS